MFKFKLKTFLLILLVAGGLFYGYPRYRTHVVQREVEVIFGASQERLKAIASHGESSESPVAEESGFLGRVFQLGWTISENVTRVNETKEEYRRLSEELHQVDLSGCPAEFRSATEELIVAWDSYAQAYDESTSLNFQTLFGGGSRLEDSKKRLADAVERYQSFQGASFGLKR